MDCVTTTRRNYLELPGTSTATREVFASIGQQPHKVVCRTTASRKDWGPQSVVDLRATESDVWASTGERGAFEQGVSTQRERESDMEEGRRAGSQAGRTAAEKAAEKAYRQGSQAGRAGEWAGRQGGQTKAVRLTGI
ncbi:hypothetical protein BC831DRAFT_188477 [Entophlyctis helioformis]|nr:hypothetical protein BC831DRAFT_188477 [Entophlyctis helioformis]